MFRLEPERAHHCAETALKLAELTPLGGRALSRAFSFSDPSLRSRVLGLEFPNPIGLAAGFDKDCRLTRILPALGFGFIESGTVTPRPQPGNPPPRLFRVPEVQGLINRMGFNNVGAAAAGETLSKAGPSRVPVGINLGINKDTRPEDAPAQYAQAFETLFEHGDFFTVNVSSPNTEGLRRLQEKLRLERILLALDRLNRGRKPVFVKLSPDLEEAEVLSLLPVLLQHASGVVCTNTTLSRPDLPEYAANLRGGLSGAPLKDLSTRMIRLVFTRSAGRLPIIGVGGVFTAEDAFQKLCAGASLVQVYTGLVYRGPGLAKEINRGLARILKDQGIARIADAVGRSHPEIARVR